MTYFKHPTADIQCVHIGEGTRIWQFVVALPAARIGRDCNICSHCFIENDVTIGDRVTLKSGVQVWDGIEIGDDVFVGPSVAFTNDRFPRSGVHPAKFARTVIHKNASIGANATILPGIAIGEHAMIGAGAVVTRSVPPNAIVVGNPAKIVGYVNAKSRSIDAAAEPPLSSHNPRGVRSTSVRGVTLHSMRTVPDMRGSLSVGEFEREIPFKPLRYFLVYAVPTAETRGEHAHRQCHQFLVAVHGSLRAVADDGENREEIVLDRPNLGLYLPPMTWGIQYHYSADAVLLVFASDHYEASDYVRDYGDFLRLQGKQQ
jgi:UDP-2-acetamido-3-amino-2,3-dideoxy-glucuronate N-acetyltransferase